ncbi:MAG: hypothetical protein IPO03_05255 [Bacteroidetes bacterium]|nr:hypothetical protein [Bacteroidota bacterium]
MFDDFEDIYQLAPEVFFKRCLKEFKVRSLYSDYDTFCTDQLEHLDLIAEKYRNLVKQGQKTNITKDQFIKLKKYQRYFTKLKEKEIKTFDTLFEEAVKYDKIEKPMNEASKAAEISLHNFCFNVWLQKNKGWEVEDGIDYIRLLTAENFLNYLKDAKAEVALNRLAIQAEDDMRKLEWQGKDTRYWIQDTMQLIKNGNPEYIGLERIVKENGCIIVNTGNEKVKIFTPELAFILLFELNATNMDSQEEGVLRKSEYFESYVNGYEDGLLFFKSNFHISNDTLYSSSEKYVANLHYQYYHLENDDTLEGWQFVRKSYPFIITHKEIKKYGRYSGIIDALYEIMDKHPIPFKSFKDECDYSKGNAELEIINNPNNLTSEEKPNDVLESTIADYMEEFKNEFKSESDFKKVTQNLYLFFSAKELKNIPSVFIKNGNKTKLGYALGELYRGERNIPITKDYLLILKQLFSIYADEDLESKPINQTNLYKYSTTKTK